MVLLLQFSLSPFKQYIVVAVILCKGRQHKAVCPKVSFGGCLGSRGTHFTEQANGQRVVGRCSCQRETALPTCFLH